MLVVSHYRAAKELEAPSRSIDVTPNINTDLDPLNHGLNSVWRLAQDRERWKQLGETATLQTGGLS